MTTLAEDTSSWKASGVIRRDFRASKDGPEAPRHRRSKKGRPGKWCRRKVGVEHQTYTVARGTGRWGYYVDICKVCGKHIRWWHGLHR
jgi:hypothetical protein